MNDQPGTLTGVPQDDRDLNAFDAATAVRRSEGGGLVADLDGGWEVGGGILNGGYLLAVAGRAAVLESPHEHPVALAASYLRAPAAGPATLTVQGGTAGRTLAHCSVVLADADGPALSVQVTTATLQDGESEHAVPAPEMPPVEECVSVAESRHLAQPDVPIPGLSQRLDMRLDPATSGWALGRPSGEPVIRGWMRFADGRDPDPLALVLFCDALPPTGFAVGRMGWAPTVQLQVLVRAVPAAGWCLVEARGGEMAGGWVDEDYRVWDSTGRLVAQSRQLARAAR